jgi:hypothetical protein
MTSEKALQIAQLVKLFARVMTDEDTDQAEAAAREFNEKIDEFFEEYPEENITTFACHLSRAIDPPGDIETPINADVFARVLPDVVAVRGGVL